MRKKKTARGHINRHMNPEVYALRSRVMNIIYEAKGLADFGRIDVRITDCNREALGTARMGDHIVWIPASSVEREDLRHIVFHEIVHAVKAQPHVPGCPLMDAFISDTTREQQDKAFQKYMA